MDPVRPPVIVSCVLVHGAARALNDELEAKPPSPSPWTGTGGDSDNKDPGRAAASRARARSGSGELLALSTSAVQPVVMTECEGGRSHDWGPC